MKTYEVKLNMYNVIGIFLLAWGVYGLWIVRDYLLLFFLALTLSIFIEEFIVWFEKRHIPRFLSVPLIYFIAFLLFIGSFAYFVPIMVNEFSTLAQNYPELGKYLDVVKQFSMHFQEKGVSFLYDSLNEQSIAKLFNIFTGIFGGIVNFFIVFVVSFYLSIYKNGVERVIEILSPEQYEEYALRIWKNIQHKIASWFRGQIFLSLLIFIITFIGLSIIGTPYALLLSLLAGVFSLVPYGIVLATLPALVLSFSYGGVKTMLITLAFYVLVQQLIDYVIQPFISKKTAGVPSVLVIVSVISATKLFGVIGLILAVPLAITILELLKTLDHHKKQLREKQGGLKEK